MGGGATKMVKVDTTASVVVKTQSWRRRARPGAAKSARLVVPTQQQQQAMDELAARPVRSGMWFIVHEATTNSAGVAGGSHGDLTTIESAQ